MMKVTEASPETVTVFVRGGQKIEGQTYAPVDDYTIETKDGMILHLGKCFIVNNHIIPASIIEKVTARQTEVREVVVYGLNRASIKKPEEDQ